MLNCKRGKQCTVSLGVHYSPALYSESHPHLSTKLAVFIIHEVFSAGRYDRFLEYENYESSQCHCDAKQLSLIERDEAGIIEKSCQKFND